jgi:hypothetical protein
MAVKKEDIVNARTEQQERLFKSLETKIDEQLKKFKRASEPIKVILPADIDDFTINKIMKIYNDNGWTVGRDKYVCRDQRDDPSYEYLLFS